MGNACSQKKKLRVTVLPDSITEISTKPYTLVIESGNRIVKVPILRLSENSLL